MLRFFAVTAASFFGTALLLVASLPQGTVHFG